MVDIAQLEAFERAAREGSFTRAAEALNLSQPAVSMRVTQLEAELGGPLFVRAGRQLTLTPLGQRFLPYAQRVLAVLTDGLQEAHSYRTGRAGQLKVAAPAPFLLSFLVSVFDDFRRAHPSVDVLIRERNKSTILEMLIDNTMTLGLVHTPLFDRRFITLAHLRDPIHAVVSPSHPLAQQQSNGAPLRIESLYSHTIFRVSASPQMSVFMDELAEQGRLVSGGGIMAVPMIMALPLVSMGRGVTFLPQSYVKESLAQGTLVALTLEDMPTLYSEVMLIRHRERALDVPHRAFVELFRARWVRLCIDSDAP